MRARTTRRTDGNTIATAALVAAMLVAAGCAARSKTDTTGSEDAASAPVMELHETVTVHAARLALNGKRGRAAPPAGSTRFAAVYTQEFVLPPEGGLVEGEFDTETYDAVLANPFLDPRHDPLSTFSIDVDTASYANVRRFLREGRRPPGGAVRIEELVNYFTYEYPTPRGSDPFAVDVEIAEAPWAPTHRLARIGIQGVEVAAEDRPAANLVFLLDVSGSMQAANKLALVQSSMNMLLETLTERDRVAIVVYAGAAGLALPPTPASDRATIVEAIESLEAGGSTAGGAGIRLAYATARDGLVEGGINRVVLCTDGDFNVGVTSQSELVTMIEAEAKDGVFLTVLGFGMGNYKDSTLEKLADRGNGNYGYIDTRHEARKMLVEEVGGTLVRIARDVKLQVEFNPATVAAYRLIGYENRLLRAQDFNDDTKDAGEIGAGHSVTALYEIVPVGVPFDGVDVDDLVYRELAAPSGADGAGDLFTLKIRYKAPDGDTSRLRTEAVVDGGGKLSAATDDFRFAAAVAGFGLALRDDTLVGDSWSLDDSAELARTALGADAGGYRAGFLELVDAARALETIEFTRN